MQISMRSIDAYLIYQSTTCYLLMLSCSKKECLKLVQPEAEFTISHLHHRILLQ